MIQFDYMQKSYVCPFCQKTQALNNTSFVKQQIGFCAASGFVPQEAEDRLTSLKICSIKCSNPKCEKITVLAMNYGMTGRVCDIIPKKVIRQFPDYIPQQIRNDYEEATSILNDSPKAAATLLRRCLQGMIHDYWGIYEKNLNAEITALKDKVTQTQWAAIDSLRKMGNIGSHMEQDVNLIIDIDSDEARRLMRLIETLFNKWYIAMFIFVPTNR